MLTLIKEDELLKPFETQLEQRNQWFNNTLQYIEKDFGSLGKLASAHHFLGFNYDEEKQGYWFRDWLPKAKNAHLIGEFNDWNFSSHPLHLTEFGIWETFLPKESIPHNSKIKLAITTQTDEVITKIPAYIHQVFQNEDFSYDGIFLEPSTFKWKDEAFEIPENFQPIIYECHIGMATEEHKVGTYQEFTQNVLPRIKKLGYNAIQLMAIQEHPYYASFGYQVANYFAPSSRFGTPEDLKNLINTAHSLGIAVILDVVHSHSVKNEAEGLTNYDGTDIYFNGNHPDWDSRLFDYGKIEVKKFLLSNLQYWMEAFHFDGFRFDGVTSMLYHHHGHIDFDSYEKFFQNTNNDAILYLQLANELIHQQPKRKISICEDMSGMPGACQPIKNGGLGFDYRLAMGIPDYWTTLLETTQDEDWQIGELFWRLTNRRLGEKTIAYAESHDQALVGDKSIAFWLMDQEMYTKMSVLTESLVVDRGIALHKLIRFVTILLGGEGYMTFMGNEFGHPEWVDFPRAGNYNSYHYARRQWSLADAEHLKYQFLQHFDEAMIHFVQKYDLLKPDFISKLYEDNEKKLLVFSKNGLIFMFNFSNETYAGIEFETYTNCKEFKIVFSSDEKKFGGFGRNGKWKMESGITTIQNVELLSRSVLVLRYSS